jgi:soluble lytic murein transglycosylase-like protein
MQFMPATARGLGIDPTDPNQAIEGAARYLRQQLDRFGSLELAVAAYNAGPGAVARFGGVPPYAETRSYVTKVLGAYRALT